MYKEEMFLFSNNQKECCKYCNNLNFYDNYFCSIDNTPKTFITNDIYIEDIEKCKCEKFKKRKGKFWLYENSEF